MRLLFALVCLSVISCRGSMKNVSTLREVTVDGFRYEQVTLKVDDVTGQAVSSVPGVMSSYHWDFEWIQHDPLIGLPLPGRGWVWKIDEFQKALGYTDSEGVVMRRDVTLKARGQRPSEKPAGIQFYGVSRLDVFCEGGGVYKGTIDLSLKTVSQFPEYSDQASKEMKGKAKFSDDCQINLSSKEDTYKELRLHCKTHLTVAQIDAEIKRLRSTCPASR